LTAATVAAVNIGGTDYFWGFIEMWKPLAGVGVGGIRMRRSATDPRGYDLIELRSGNQWTAVANDGTFTFEPDFLWIGINMAKLVWSGTDWYLWGSGGGTPEHCGSCDHLYSAQGNWSDRFVYRKVRTDYSMDPIETVDSGIRCMPGGYPSSRTFPMPAPGGLLYSSTNEGNCGLYTDPNYGNYIVVTAIQ
ncbi:MAG TPA: hypothetical protein VHL59_05685, partial [Thermoanaerobaculia bacterium]|nr:hypothetical protein [Thermoanaerobaculia bacterium]